MNNDLAETARESAACLALSHGADDPRRARAFATLVDRAVQAYGIAMHYGGDDPDAVESAMGSALEAVARGFAAAALEAVTEDAVLALSVEQKSRLDELVIELDGRIVDVLGDA